MNTHATEREKTAFDRVAFGKRIVDKTKEIGMEFNALNEVMAKRYKKQSKDLSDGEMLDLFEFLSELGKTAIETVAIAEHHENNEQTALSQFDAMITEIKTAVAPVLSMKITNEEEQKLALGAGKEVKRLLKKVEDRRAEVKAPFLDMCKKIEQRAKDVSAPLLQAESHLKAEAIKWNRTLEERAAAERKRIDEERRKLEEEARKREAEQKAALESANLFGSEDQVAQTAQQITENFDNKEIAAKKLDAEEKKVVKASRVAGVRKFWTFKITDPNQVPREYLMINEPALRKAITENSNPESCTLAIPGVEIYQEQSMSFRG